MVSAFLVLAGNASMLAFHLFAALRIGKVATVALGVMGCVLSVLMWTSLGDARVGDVALWCLVPYGWGARFVANYLSTVAYDNVTAFEQNSWR